MRVLVTAAPAVGHLLPVLPAAIAAQAHGHDVLVGCGSSLAPIVRRAGLRHVDLGPPDLDAVRAALPGLMTMAGRDRARRMYQEGFASISAARLAADLLTLADTWLPHVIVHDDMEMGSSIVAEQLAIPHVVVQATAWRPWQRRFLVEPLNGIRQRMGLPLDASLAGFDGAMWITTRPGSMRDPAVPLPAAHREMRPVPDDRLAGDPKVEDAWLDEPIARPRIGVTLGTVNAGRVDVVRAIVDGLAGLDVEVVVALGADPSTLGEVPPNVRVEPYVAMSRLAPRCDAIVHHAGAGTTLATFAAGRPAALVPLTADQFDNAAAALRTGAAIELDATRLSPEAVRYGVRDLIGRSTFRVAAQAVADEIAAMPDPVATWREIEALARGPVHS
ncbi:MAG TPA: glycosyltransferase [Candidatus Limnocylindrales bacterium]|nr:glycosyltransferase [Candidatus Limnocylindrales bacterium]